MSEKTRNFHFLLHSADLLEKHLRQQLLPLGIGPRQARILDAISMLEPVSQIRLARVFSITAPSMSSMAGRLIAAGLIERKVDPNEARCNLLNLTDSGRDCVGQIEDVWSGVDQMIIEIMGKQGADQLNEVTLALRDLLGGRGPEKNDETL